MGIRSQSNIKLIRKNIVTQTSVPAIVSGSGFDSDISPLSLIEAFLDGNPIALDLLTPEMVSSNGLRETLEYAKRCPDTMGGIAAPKTEETNRLLRDFFKAPDSNYTTLFFGFKGMILELSLEYDKYVSVFTREYAQQSPNKYGRYHSEVRWANSKMRFYGPATSMPLKGQKQVNKSLQQRLLLGVLLLDQLQQENTRKPLLQLLQQHAEFDMRDGDDH